MRTHERDPIVKTHLPFEWPRATRVPLVVAHRGSSASAPENTMSAFRLAAAHGADGVELDVQLTADRSVVVYHDRTLKRTTGHRGRISATDFGRIKALDCGSWFDPCFADERVPVLADVLELFDGRLFVNIELKNSPQPGIVDAVIEAVHASRTSSSVLVSSFDHRLVAELRRKAPELARAVLVRPFDFGAPSRSARRVGAQAVVMARSQLRIDRVTDAHEHGLAVIVYTVDRPQDIARCVRLGVDAIITNDPAATRAQLQGLE